MATPKGTRMVPFCINETDAVHVYTREKTIWVQLRRSIPTEKDVGQPSFKIALPLSAEQAIALAGELLTAATQRRNQPAARAIEPTKPANHGKPWTPEEDRQLCARFASKVPVAELAKRHKRGPLAIESRLTKLGKLAPQPGDA